MGTISSINTVQSIDCSGRQLSPQCKEKSEALKKVEQTVDKSLSDLVKTVSTEGKKEEWDEKQVSEKRYNIIIRFPETIEQEVQKKIEELPILENIQKIVDTPNWDPANPIFKNTDHYYYALAALFAKTITNHQFGTLMMFRTELIYSKDIRVISVLDKEGKLSSEAAGLIMQSLYPGPDVKDALDHKKQEAMRQQQEPLLNPKQMRQFTENISKLPKSEQQFLLVPSKLDNDVTLVISYFRKFNVFSKVLIKNLSTGEHNLHQMIPSFGMMQTFLDVFAGENAPRLEIVLGDCIPEDFDQDALNGTRKVGVHFHNLPQSPKADNQDALGNCFTIHDFYHAFIAACMPKTHRIEMRTASILLQKIAGTTVSNLREYLLDMENVHYSPEHQSSINKYISDAKQRLDVTFWAAIASHCKIFTQKEKDTLEKVLQCFVQHFAVEKKGRKAGISREGLLKATEITEYTMEVREILKRMKEIYEEQLSRNSDD